MFSKITSNVQTTFDDFFDLNVEEWSFQQKLLLQIFFHQTSKKHFPLSLKDAVLKVLVQRIEYLQTLFQQKSRKPSWHQQLIELLIAPNSRQLQQTRARQKNCARISAIQKIPIHDSLTPFLKP